MPVRKDHYCLQFPLNQNQSLTVWRPMLKAGEHFLFCFVRRGPIQSWRICEFLHSTGGDGDVDAVLERMADMSGDGASRGGEVGVL